MEKFKTILDLALGDGYITKQRSENGNSTLRMNHSIKQKEYLLLKKEMLEEVGIKSIYREYTDKNGFRVCYVLTRRYPEITEVRRLLYVNGIKTISQRLIDILDERSLSLLFQDDGGAEIVRRKNKNSKSIDYINNFVLNVQSFGADSVKFLSEWLDKTLIQNKIYKRKGQLVITIPKLISKMNFIEIITPYMHKSMMYKIEKPLTSLNINW